MFDYKQRSNTKEFDEGYVRINWKKDKYDRKKFKEEFQKSLQDQMEEIIRR